MVNVGCQGGRHYYGVETATHIECVHHRVVALTLLGIASCSLSATFVAGVVQRVARHRDPVIVVIDCGRSHLAVVLKLRMLSLLVGLLRL